MRDLHILLKAMPIILLLPLPAACEQIDHYSQRSEAILRNKMVISKAKYNVIFNCGKSSSLNDGVFAGNVIGVNAIVTTDGQVIEYKGNMGGQFPFPPPARQAPVIAGVTKFIAVTGQVNWHMKGNAGDDFTNGDGGVMVDPEVFPHHRPIEKTVTIHAVDSDGKPVPGETFPVILPKGALNVIVARLEVIRLPSIGKIFKIMD